MAPASAWGRVVLIPADLPPVIVDKLANTRVTAAAKRANRLVVI